MRAGFDMDFYLDWRWAGNPNGYNILLRNTDTPLTRGGDAGYFNADADTTIKPFLDQYLPQPHDCERAHGLFDLITGNHDTLRVGQRLTARELKLAYGMLLTMPGCPFVYHGDEIAMRYRDLPTFEGGYIRTGSRTPMQWVQTRRISASPPPRRPIAICRLTPAPDAPDVAHAMADPDSLWRWMQNCHAL